MMPWTEGCKYLFELAFSFSLDKYPEVDKVHMLALFLIFWGDSILSSAAAAPVCTPTHNAPGFFFSPHPHQHLLFLVFLIITILTGDISLWFWFAFPWWLVTLGIFSCVCWPSYVFFEKNVYSNPLPIFNWIFVFYCYWVVWLLYVFSIYTPY